MPWVTVNNVNINYIEQGTGDEAIVFAHGFGAASGEWWEVLELLPREYHAYALDQRGHGKSDKPGIYGLNQFAEDIYDFSRELGIGRFTYIGHSMGGPIGIRLALDHPDVLKAMVLVAPSPAHAWMTSDMEAALKSTKGFDDMVTAMKSMFGSPQTIRGVVAMGFATPPSEERMNELIDYALAMDYPAVVDICYPWILSPGLEPHLGEIRVPTLIVAGGKDMTPIDALRRTADGIKGCHFEVFEDNGHMLNMESPQRLVDLLASFIEEASRE